MSSPSPNAAAFCGRIAARPSSSRGMPMSPPETTSVASWPTTCPSCMAKRAPPMPRIIRLAPSIEACTLLVGDLLLAGCRELFALAQGDAPVDALIAATVHRLLQLPEEGGEARRVVGKAGRPCEARRIDAARAREELAEHLAELVFGVPVARLTVGFGHCRHLQVASPQ